MNPYEEIMNPTAKEQNPYQSIMANTPSKVANDNPYTDIMLEGKQNSKNLSWNDFMNLAKEKAKQKGFPVNVLLAQAALESARGKAARSNNYFGIKGRGTAGSNNLATQEYGARGYYGENSNFAAYNTPNDAVDAYLNLVMSYPGVKEAMTTGSSVAVLQAIKNAGYATSPTYVQDVANTPEFKGENQ